MLASDRRGDLRAAALGKIAHTEHLFAIPYKVVQFRDLFGVKKGIFIFNRQQNSTNKENLS